MAEPERLLSLALPDVQKQYRARRPRDAWQKAVYRLVPWAGQVQSIEPVWQISWLRAMLPLPQARAGEWELPQVQWPLAQQASPQPAPLQVLERKPAP